MVWVQAFGLACKGFVGNVGPDAGGPEGDRELAAADLPRQLVVPGGGLHVLPAAVVLMLGLGAEWPVAQVPAPSMSLCGGLLPDRRTPGVLL